MRPWPLLVVALFGCATTGGIPQSERLLGEGARAFDERRHGDANHAFRMALAAAEEEGETEAAVIALSELAHIAFLAGELERGRVLLEEARSHARPGAARGWAAFLLATGAGARAEGEARRALVAFAALHDHGRASGLPRRALQGAHMAGLVSEGQERIDWLERSLRVAEDSGRLAWTTPALEQLAMARLERVRGAVPDGERVQEVVLAIELLDRARAGWRELGQRFAVWALTLEIAEAGRLAGMRGRAVAELEPLAGILEDELSRSISVEVADLLARSEQSLAELAAEQGLREDELHHARRALGAARLARWSEERPAELRALSERLGAPSGGEGDRDPVR